MPKPSAATIHREYLYSPGELREALNLRGEKVLKVTYELGYFSVWTAGDEGDGPDA
jgi:hypothetical protein